MRLLSFVQALSPAPRFRHRGWVRVILIILTVLLLCPGYAALDPRARWGPAPSISAKPLALDAKDPQRRTVGALTYLGGVHLRSNDRAFGGYSSLIVRGDDVLMLSDGGLWAQFRLSDDMQPSDLRTGDLPVGPGPGRIREYRDTESMVLDPRTGSLWVGYENLNTIWRYSAGFKAVEGMRWPKAMAEWSRNGGAESMALLRSGWFLVLAEEARAPAGGRVGLAFDGDPTTREPRFTFSYVPPKGYSPTDMTQLPDGRLLVLNRRFALADQFTAKLTLIDTAAIRPGARVPAVELATLAAPLLHDNFEGLAVTREGKDVIVWIVSDDNGPSLWQRTLLLKFRLDLPPPYRASTNDSGPLSTRGKRADCQLDRGRSRGRIRPRPSRSASCGRRASGGGHAATDRRRWS